ncbi:MAG: MarR family transcriptional regulator [Chrysiogenales bacterium]|nr:MAG: MarR family transcriptional regulator [Chrysiogenales bacterium]
MIKPLLKKLSNERLEEILFHSLRTIYLFERSEIETFGLDYQQMYLLKILKRRFPLRISDIAHELRIPVFTATRLIHQLVAEGLVCKNRDSRDRRNIYVRMTGAGEAMVGRIESHITTLIMERLTEYPAEQVRIILKVVRDLDMILGVPVDDEEEVNGQTGGER